METREPARQREEEDRRPEGIVSEVEGFNRGPGGQWGTRSSKRP